MKKLIFIIMLISSSLYAVNNQYNPLIFSGFQDYDALTASTATYSSNSDKLDGQHASEFANRADVITSTTNITTNYNNFYSSYTYMLSNIQSGGRISGGQISAHTPANGQVDISTMAYGCKITNDQNASYVFGVINSTTITLSYNNDLNYIYFDYNAGSPRYLTINDRTLVNEYNQFVIGRDFREDNDVTEFNNTGVNIYNEYRRIHDRLLEKFGLDHISGAIVTESGTRGLATTGGTWYIGNSGFTTPAKVLADGFDLYRTSNTLGQFYVTTGNTQLGNTQYDNGTGSLSTLTNNRYGVYWVYICVQGDRYVMYGQAQYANLSAAQSAQPPSTLPTYINKNTRLAAKIIFVKNGTNFAEVDSAWDVSFTPGSGGVSADSILSGSLGSGVIVSSINAGNYYTAVGWIATSSATVNRDVDNYVTSINYSLGRTITITRDLNNYITSYTDGIRTWTFTRNSENYITNTVVTP